MAATKVIFKNKYDKKISGNFYRYFMLRNSFFMYVITVFGLIALFMLVSGFIKQEDDATTNFLMWTIAVVGVLFVPLYTFMNIRTATNRDYHRRKDTEEVIEITKEKVIRQEITSNQKVVLNWLLIDKIVEMNDVFYIFLAKDEAFTIKKAGLVEGTIEEFRFLIKTYLKKDKKGNVPFIVKDKEYNLQLKEAKKQLKLAKKQAKQNKGTK